MDKVWASSDLAKTFSIALIDTKLVISPPLAAAAWLASFPKLVAFAEHVRRTAMNSKIDLMYI
jgi:hypothetical protein